MFLFFNTNAMIPSVGRDARVRLLSKLLTKPMTPILGKLMIGFLIKYRVQ